MLQVGEAPAPPLPPLCCACASLDEEGGSEETNTFDIDCRPPPFAHRAAPSLRDCRNGWLPLAPPAGRGRGRHARYRDAVSQFLLLQIWTILQHDGSNHLAVAERVSSPGIATLLSQFVLLTVSVVYYQGLLEIQAQVLSPPVRLVPSRELNLFRSCLALMGRHGIAVRTDCESVRRGRDGSLPAAAAGDVDGRGQGAP